MKTKKENQIITKTIIDINDVDFNQNHKLWWMIDNGKVLDFFNYTDFIEYVKTKINNKWNDEYATVTIESQFSIEIIFIKGKSKENIKFWMCD